jgi:hypothetical protein
MFHVELRQFPHVGRVFNLSPEELQARILASWVAGASIDLNERRWSPEKTRLTILEGPELHPDEMGLGRGWANAGKDGRDVTAELVGEAERQLRPPPAAELKDEIVALCDSGATRLDGVVELASRRNPQRRPSELLATAEQAVWELLHQGRVRILSGGEPIDRDRWQQVLLSWSSWTAAGPDAVMLEATAPAPASAPGARPGGRGLSRH